MHKGLISKWVGAVACIVMISGGCARYHAFPLERLRTEFHPSTIKADSVAVSVEVLDKPACKRHFSKELPRAGFQPVQITVVNGARRYLELHHSQISLPAAEPQMVAETCHFSTAGRATTYGVIGIFIWPFLIPAIVDGAGSAKANGQMDIDFASKALRDDVIMPHGMANGVLFVPVQSMSQDLSIRLVDRETRDNLVFRWSNGQPIEGIVVAAQPNERSP